MGTLCFILMPFGTKTDGNKKEINFDEVYNSFIKKAIVKAGLDPIRADEEKGGGFIHKPMYERLMFCDFAVADLSFSNANVFYELGIRHALKPYTTVSIFEVNTKLPFDTAPLRTFPYKFEDGKVADVDKQVEALSELIKINVNAKKMLEDSPIGQLIQGYKFPDLNYLQKDADAFAENVVNTNNQKEALDTLVKQWKELDKAKGNAATEEEKNKIKASQQQVIESITKIRNDEGNNLRFNYDLLYSILNAYKRVNAFDAIADMLKPLVDSSFNDNIYIKQQLGLAYNKIGKREDAKTVLETITDKYGPDPETNGLLGAVYKGLMDDKIENKVLARTYRKKAIDTYLGGFEADPRDYYPGVNALTLMFLGDSVDERFNKFIPIVTYAVERQLPTKQNDYWVQATALEIAALNMNEDKATDYYGASVACNPQNWMKETTAGNLAKIYNKALITKDEKSLEWLKAIAVDFDPEIFNKK